LDFKKAILDFGFWISTQNLKLKTQNRFQDLTGDGLTTQVKARKCPIPTTERQVFLWRFGLSLEWRARFLF
jgi:hypothetical protein